MSLERNKIHKGTIKGSLAGYKQREIGENGENSESAFYFLAEISNTNVDSYFTKMAISTLQNFAEDARNGVSLQDSHDYRKLGYGQSFDATFEASKVIAEFYTVPGIRMGGTHSFASTDDFIKAIEGGLIRDVSVGFYGGEERCDICGQAVWAWDSDCIHFPGKKYSIDDREVLATATIYDARLAEVSVVFDGATPGAKIIEKANHLFDDGRLNEKEVRGLERAFQVRILGQDQDKPFVNDDVEKLEEKQERERIELQKKNRGTVNPEKDAKKETDSELDKSINNNTTDKDSEPNENDQDQIQKKSENPDQNNQQDELEKGSDNNPEKENSMDLEKVQESLEGYREKIAGLIEDAPEDALEAIESILSEFEKVTSSEEELRESLSEKETELEKANEKIQEFEGKEDEIKQNEKTVEDVQGVYEQLSETMEDLPESFSAAFELLLERFKNVKEQKSLVDGEKSTLEEKVNELKPLADYGKQYRQAVIDHTINQGIRAHGDKFDVESKTKMLENCSLEVMDEFYNSWKDIGDAKFGKDSEGRKTHDGEEEDDEQKEEQELSKDYRDYIPPAAFK